MMNLKPSDRLYNDPQYQHAQFVMMLRRMVASGINDSKVSPARLAQAEAEYVRLYGVEVPS